MRFDVSGDAWVFFASAAAPSLPKNTVEYALFALAFAADHWNKLMQLVLLLCRVCSICCGLCCRPLFSCFVLGCRICSCVWCILLVCNVITSCRRHGSDVSGDAWLFFASSAAPSLPKTTAAYALFALAFAANHCSVALAFAAACAPASGASCMSAM